MLTRLGIRRVQTALLELRRLGELEIEFGAGPFGTNRYKLLKFLPETVSKGGALQCTPPALHCTGGDEVQFTGGMQSTTQGGAVHDAEGVQWSAPNPSEESTKEPPYKNKTYDTASPVVAGVLPSVTVKKPAGTKPPAKTNDTWTAYSTAYEARYGTQPLRNGAVNSMLSKFIDRVGADNAPAIAVFFVASPDKYFVANLHPVALLLKHAESLHTQWKLNIHVTSTQINALEKAAMINHAVQVVSQKYAEEASTLHALSHEKDES